MYPRTGSKTGRVYRLYSSWASLQTLNAELSPPINMGGVPKIKKKKTENGVVQCKFEKQFAVNRHVGKIE